jgi:hypothetical protein
MMDATMEDNDGPDDPALALKVGFTLVEPNTKDPKTTKTNTPETEKNQKHANQNAKETTPAAANADAVTVNFTVDFCYRSDDQNLNFAKPHLELIKRIFTVTGNNMTLYATGSEGENNSISSMDHFPKSDDKHKEFFSRKIIRPKLGRFKIKIQVEHKIEMPLKLRDLKHNTQIWNFIKEKNGMQIYINSPDLQRSEYQSIGFLYGLPPSILFRPTLDRKLNRLISNLEYTPEDKLLAAKNNPETPKDTIPPRPVVSTWVKPVGVGNAAFNEVMYPAIEVRCLKIHKDITKKHMMQISRMNKLPQHSKFIPYGTLNQGGTKSEDYRRILQNHTREVQKLSAVAVFGLTKELLSTSVKYKEEEKTVTHFIRDSHLFISIEESLQTTTRGKYFLQVAHNKHGEATKFIDSFFSAVYLSKQIPTHLSDLFEYFPYPRRGGISSLSTRPSEEVDYTADIIAQFGGISTDNTPLTLKPWTSRKIVFDLQEFPELNPQDSIASPVHTTTTAPTTTTTPRTTFDQDNESKSMISDKIGTIDYSLTTELSTAISSLRTEQESLKASIATMHVSIAEAVAKAHQQEWTTFRKNYKDTIEQEHQERKERLEVQAVQDRRREEEVNTINLQLSMLIKTVSELAHRQTSEKKNDRDSDDEDSDVTPVITTRARSAKRKPSCTPEKQRDKRSPAGRGHDTGRGRGGGQGPPEAVSRVTTSPQRKRNTNGNAKTDPEKANEMDVDVINPSVIYNEPIDDITEMTPVTLTFEPCAMTTEQVGALIEQTPPQQTTVTATTAKETEGRGSG